MNRETDAMSAFLRQFPEFKEVRSKLKMNIYGDVLLEEDGKRRIIAESDLPHNLDLIGEELTETWTLKKMGRPLSEDGRKAHDLRVRVPETLYNRVVRYSEEHDQTTAETVREALNKYLS